MNYIDVGVILLQLERECLAHPEDAPHVQILESGGGGDQPLDPLL